MTGRLTRRNKRLLMHALSNLEILGTGFVKFLEDVGLIAKKEVTEVVDGALANPIAATDLELRERELQLRRDSSQIGEEEFRRESERLAIERARLDFLERETSIAALRGEVPDDVLDREALRNIAEYNLELQEINLQFELLAQQDFLDGATFDELIEKARQLKLELTFQDDATLSAFLDNVDQRIREILGTTSANLASDLQGAISGAEGDYEKFARDFGLSLERRVQEGLINAVIQSAVVQTALSGLSDVITEALSDGVIDSLDIGAIQVAQGQVQSLVEPIFDSLNALNVFGDSARAAAETQEEASRVISDSADTASESLNSITESINNAPQGFFLPRLVRETLDNTTPARTRGNNFGLGRNDTTANIDQSQNNTVNISGNVFGINGFRDFIADEFNRLQKE